MSYGFAIEWRHPDYTDGKWIFSKFLQTEAGSRRSVERQNESSERLELETEYRAVALNAGEVL